MKQNRWRVLFVVGLTLWAAYGVAPSLIYFSTPKEVRTNAKEFESRIPNFLPKQHVKLGLEMAQIIHSFPINGWNQKIKER